MHLKSAITLAFTASKGVAKTRPLKLRGIAQFAVSAAKENWGYGFNEQSEVLSARGVTPLGNLDTYWGD
jgi:hypothetical protein